MVYLSNHKNSNWKRQISFFFLSQTISLLGSAIVSYAIIWYVTLTTASGLMMTISTLSTFLPQILVSFYAGVWADRYSRKKLIIWADFLIALSTIFLTIFFFMGYRELWLLFLVSGIRSFGTGVQTPAVSALVPQIVPQKYLMKVNGINGSIQSLTFIVAPAISGGLLAAFPLEYCFIIDIMTAVIAIIILSLLRIPTYQNSCSELTTRDAFKAGFNYIIKHSFIRTLFIFYALYMFLIVPASFLTPLLLTRLYGGSVWHLTLNEITFSSGTLVGGMLIALWGGFPKRIKTMAFGSILLGFSVIFIALSPNFIFYLVFILIIGFAIPFLTTPTTVLIQEKTTIDMQGRVFSLLQLIATIALPLGMIIFGPLADHLEIQSLLIFSGLLIIILSIRLIVNPFLKNETSKSLKK